MKQPFAAALLAATLAVTGCSSFDTMKTADGDKVKYQVIHAGDTENRLEVIETVAAKAGDLMRGSVEVQNGSRDNYTFEYRFKWYDAAGMEINAESTAWTPVTMSPQETKSLQSLAPNPTGTTFKLFLKD